MLIFSAHLAPGLNSALKYPVCFLPMCYIRPLGVERGDLRGLRLLPDESLVLRCQTPSVRSSETCPVLATGPPPVCPHPNLWNRNPLSFVLSKILPENVLVSPPLGYFISLPFVRSLIFWKDLSLFHHQIRDFVPLCRDLQHLLRSGFHFLILMMHFRLYPLMHPFSNTHLFLIFRYNLNLYDWLCRYLRTP